jgi:purine-binding chemotaxis protein CheW
MEDELTLLTFLLDEAWYGVPVCELQEVVPLPALTLLVDAPPSVCGIFNLRGQVVTTIDLKKRLGLKSRPWDLKNGVLITRAQEKLYGFIVDETLSLITLSTQDVEPSPEISSVMGDPHRRLVRAIGKLDGRLIPILNLSGILTTFEPPDLGDRQPGGNHG